MQVGESISWTRKNGLRQSGSLADLVKNRTRDLLVACFDASWRKSLAPPPPPILYRRAPTTPALAYWDFASPELLGTRTTMKWAMA